MLNERMQAALNQQLNAELYSSYLYLSMSAHLRMTKMPGAGSWMRVQAREEMTHATKFFDYLVANGKVVLQPVDVPQSAWESPLASFEHVLRHEQHVTSMINNLVTIADAEGDQVTRDFLQWFVKEQEEEEESAEKVLAKLRVMNSDLQVLMFDQELGERR